MATSKPENMAEEVARYLEIYDYFDIICGADLHGPRQSKQAVLEKLFDKTDFKKDKSVLVGDTKYDIEGANSIGIDSIGVTWGTGTKKEMVDEGAIEIFDDYESLINYLIGE